MINVTINGVTKQFEPGTPIKDIIEKFENQTSQFVCAASIDGAMFDLDHKVKKDCEITLLTFRDIRNQRELNREDSIASDDIENQDETDGDYYGEDDADILNELGIGSVFSQGTIDAIENEIRNMVSGDFDENNMTFEPRRALELLGSADDGTFVDSDDEAVYEAVSEAVYGNDINQLTPAQSDDGDFEESIEEEPQTEEAEEEAIDETEAFEEESIEKSEDSAEPVDVKSEKPDEADEVLQISEEQIDAIVERSNVEAALNSENIDDLCDEVISEIDKSAEPSDYTEFVADTSLSESSAYADELQDDVKTVGARVFDTVAEKPKTAKKKGNRIASNIVKAAAVIAAVGAVGWFVGRAAIEAIGSRDENDNVISRADIVSDVISSSDAVSKSDVSGSDILPEYNADMLTFGSANELVKVVQARLNELGYLDVSYISGTYDINTSNAVAEFRLNNNIDKTGYIDSDTFKLLFNGKNVVKSSQIGDQSDITTAVAATTMSTDDDESITTTTTTTTGRTTTTTTRRTTTRRTTTTTRRTTTRRTTTRRRSTTRRSTSSTSQSTLSSVTDPTTDPTPATYPSDIPTSPTTPTSAVEPSNTPGPTSDSTQPSVSQSEATGGDPSENISSQE